MRACLLALLLLGCGAPATTAEGEASAVFGKGPIVFEKVATGFRFTEGPAADAAGHVYFTDVPAERIHRFDVGTGTTSVARERTGRANGLMFDAAGRLIACEGGRRRVVRFEGERTVVLSSHWRKKRLNSPNDLALDAAGGIWFTDPRYGKQDDRELDVMAVYYVDARGRLTRPIADLERPNGILLGADGKTLYVAANRKQLVMAYDVPRPGVVARGRVFARLDPRARGGPDGLTLDDRGHVYCAGQGHLWVWNAAGQRLHKLKVPEAPTNCTFGGPERDTLYVTARTSLYRVATRVRGASPVRIQAPPNQPRAGGENG